MNEGVKILIERMKTNPEEFIKGSKWAGLIHGYKDYLNAEDTKILDGAYNELMQQDFTERVMKELLAPEEDNSLGKPWYTKQESITLSAGTTLGLSTSPSNATWGTSTLQQNIARLEEIKKQYEPKKKHKTLFGKLFNYS